MCERLQFPLCQMKNVTELKWTVIFQLKDLDRQLKYIPQNNTASTFYLVSSFFNEAPLKKNRVYPFT